MKTFAIRHRVVIEAPAETVWNLVSDHEGIHRWIDVAHGRLLKAGQPRNGVGAVREVAFPTKRFWPTIEEAIVHYEEGTAYHYRVIAGMGGLAHHLGKVTVEDVGQGHSALLWEIDFVFQPWHPIRWFAGAFIRAFGAVIAEAVQNAKRIVEAGT
jgi:hypothetical protein